MRIVLKGEIGKIARHIEASRARIDRAKVQAVNRVARDAAAQVRKELVEEINPRRKREINRAVVVKRASRLRRRAEIVTNERYIPLEQSKDTRVRSFRRGRRRVQRVTYKGKEIKGAFRPNNFTAGGNALTTQAPGRYSTGNRRLKRLYTFSILQQYESADVPETLERFVRPRIEREFSRALARA